MKPASKIFEALRASGLKPTAFESLKAMPLRNFSVESKPLEHYLIQAAQKGSKEITMVNMNEGKAVEIFPNQVKNVFTYGLCGCNGTLVLMKSKNGNPLVVLTHFDPLSSSRNISRLKDLIRERSSIIDPNVKPQVFFSVPGGLDLVGKDWVHTIKNPEQVNRLRGCLKEILGDFEETIMPYSECCSPGESRALIASFAPDNHCKISIQSVGHHFKQVEL